MTDLTAPSGVGRPLRSIRARRPTATIVASPICRVAFTAAIAAAVLLAVMYALTGDWSGQDLDVYRAGGSAVLHGHGLYDASFQTPTHLKFTYPPFAAAIFVPLAVLPQSTAIALWAFCTILAAGALVAVSSKAALGSRVDRRSLPYLIVFGGMLATSLSPLQDCMEQGQIGVFLVLMCITDVALSRTRWRRGILVGVAAALKMTPGLFIVYFAMTRDWKAMRASAATLAICWGAAAIVLPRDSYAYFVGGAAYDARRVGGVSDHLNESLNGLWHRVPVPNPTLLWLTSAAIVGFVGLWRASRAGDAGNRLAAAAIVGVTSDLVAPISWLHHAAWVVPAIVALMCHRRSRLTTRCAAFGIVAVLLVPLGELAGTHANAAGPLVEVYVFLLLAIVILLPFSRDDADGFT